MSVATRWLVVLVVACGHPAPPPAPPQPPPSRPVRPPPKSAIRVRTLSRADVAFTGGMPAHGMIVTSQGLFTARQITIDLDAATLTITGHDGARQVEHTAKLPPDTVTTLAQLATLARTESPHGDPAMYTSDSFESLDLLDGDAVFEIEGNPIHSTDGPTDRPAATNIVDAILAVSPPR